MKESAPKAKLCAELRAQLKAKGTPARVWRHEDAFTGGVPDISVNALGVTLWIEAKLSRPGRPSRPTPLQTEALLAVGGYVLEFRLGKNGKLSGAELYRALSNFTLHKQAGLVNFRELAAAIIEELRARSTNG